MFRSKLLFGLGLISIYSYSQNDLDAIRYSRIGTGGSSRFISMGGAFGAIGADLGCAAYNPAELGIYRKGDISFSGALKITSNTGSIYNQSSNVAAASTVFNNFGLAGAWKSKTDPDSRHVLAFTNTQVQNFNSTTRMSGYTNSSSIMKDMLNLTNQYKSQNGNITSNLSSSYEGLAFDTYLIDTVDNNFFSNVDLRRSVKQTRDITTKGRVNDLNFSYAYSYKDKFYIGGSIGVPQVRYESTTTHTESDDRDSMRVGFTSPNSYTTTYIDGLPAAYTGQLGFNSLTYTEYFKTTGSGINLKLGGIARVNDFLRLGFYYHTPTLYNLQDSYYNSMSASYDFDPSQPVTSTYPQNGGVFKYKIVTPSRLGLNSAFIIQKMMVIGLDYEFVNYRAAQLRSDNISDFEGVNAVIKAKYKTGQNMKLGAELNLNPFAVRVGYTMQGSPFGDVFTGDFVRNTYSAGVGYKWKNNLYLDATFAKTMSSENYFLFTSLNTMSKLKYNSSMLSVTVGIKF